MHITIEIGNILDKPMDELSSEDTQVIDEAKTQLPKKEVQLPKDEAMMEPVQNAKPVLYKVVKGDTLKFPSVSK